MDRRQFIKSASALALSLAIPSALKAEKWYTLDSMGWMEGKYKAGKTFTFEYAGTTTGRWTATTPNIQEIEREWKQLSCRMKQIVEEEKEKEKL